MRLFLRLYRAGVLVLAGALLSAGGCTGRENAVEDKGTDTAFLRYPDGTQGAATPDPNAPELASGPLFPVGVGSHWEMQTRQGMVQANSAVSGVQMNRQGSEKITVAQKVMVGEQSGALFNITATGSTNQKAGGTRQETYAVKPDGLFLLAAGSTTGHMTMSPPLPLVAYPPKEGQPLQWSGVLHYKDQTVPAASVSRVSRVQIIKVPGIPKGVAAYRVDTVISTTLLQNGLSQQVSFPTTRWLAPGIGMVQQKLIAGDQVVVKQLKTWKLTQK